MTRISRLSVVVTGVVAPAVVAVVLVVVLWPRPQRPSAAEPLDVEMTTVALRDLNESFEADGVLAPSATRNVVHQASDPALTSLVSAVPEVGLLLRPGDVIYAVNEHPVVYLPGDVPAWRTMGVDTEGVDVLQVEEALVAMGYDSAGLLSVDETYTSYTADLVALWQEDLGVDTTGELPAGSIVFAPPDDVGRTLVVDVQAEVGDPADGSSIATLSDGDQRVVFQVDTDLIGNVAAGTEVSVRLPDRREFGAAIVAGVPVGDGQWEFIAALDPEFDPGLVGSGGLPVAIGWSDELARDVLAVPAETLLRHDDGSYTVRVVDGDRVEVVTVIPGVSADRYVAVSGPLSAGDQVVVP